MSTNPPVHPDDFDAAQDSARDMRIGELLNEYVDMNHSGSRVSADEFLSRHPEYADDLRRHLKGLGLIDRLSSSQRLDDGTVALTASREVKRRDSSGAGASREGAALPRIEGYELLREIGRGGMGLVYKALQKSTKRVVAVKVLLEGQLASDAAARRFEREIALAAQLRHPGIIPIYDSGEADGRLYYAMEYVHGLPLGAYIKQHGTPLKERVRLLARICHAISHAHQRGVIHRDVKPSNVLVDNDGEPHIHDFGLAKSGSLVDVNLSMTTNLVGTPAYMSPEQVAGDPGGIDTRTDVYSLGVMLFEMITGQLPYDVTPNIAQTLNNISNMEPRRPSKLSRGVDADLETIMLKALSKTKEQRYQSAAELAADLERYLRGDAIQARPATMFYLFSKTIARHRYQALFVSLVLIAGFSLIMSNRASRNNTQLQEQLDKEEQVSAVQLDMLQQMIERGGKKFGDGFNREMEDIVAGMARKQPMQALIAKKFLELGEGLSRSLAPGTQPDDGVDVDSDSDTRSSRPELSIKTPLGNMPEAMVAELMQEALKLPQSDQAAAVAAFGQKMMELASRMGETSASQPGVPSASAPTSRSSTRPYEKPLF